MAKLADATDLQLTQERRLVFVATAIMAGWWCEPRCWHLTLGNEAHDVRPVFAFLGVQAQFDAHECEEYARLKWTSVESEPE